jgi:hypothetical protein
MWRRFGTLPSQIYKIPEKEIAVILAYMELEQEKR